MTKPASSCTLPTGGAHHPGAVETAQAALSRFMIGLVVAGLAGCAMVGPDYQRPELDVPSTLVVPAAVGASSGPTSARPVDLLTWWKSFQDPALDALLAEALSSNQDLMVAAGRIEEARANAAVTNASRYPSVDANLSSSRSRSSRNTVLLPPGANN
ncbi:MAG: hypothetical protein NVSMB6_21480 [Burkholderiaceae bacterium]